MFYSFESVPKCPKLDFTTVDITDADSFSAIMEGNSKRDKVLEFIASISQNPNMDITELNKAIENLSGSVDLVCSFICFFECLIKS